MIKQLEDTVENRDLLYSYLLLVNHDFRIPLSEKVDLYEYASKLLACGVVIVVIEKGEILSCRGFYCNDNISGTAYGTMMSTLPKAQGKGYARLLVEEMFRICREKGFKYVISSSVNPKAIALYKSVGYQEIAEVWNGGERKVTLKYNLF